MSVDATQESQEAQLLIAQRGSHVAERRRQQLTHRVGRLYAWLLPLQVLAVLAATLDHRPTWPALLGLPPWLIVAVCGAGVVLGGALVRRRWPLDRAGRIGMTVCQFLIYLLLIYGTEDHPDARSFEFASLALLSLYHDGPLLLLWVLLGGVSHLLMLGLGMSVWFVKHGRSWDTEAAVSVAEVIAVLLYSWWDRVDGENAAKREARLELESERRRAIRGELRDTSERYKRILDANLVGIVLYERDFSIIDVNDAYLAIVGYSRQELTSVRGILEGAIAASRPEEVSALMDELRSHGFYRSRELMLQCKDGTLAPVLSSGAHVGPNNSQTVGFIQDIRALKGAEQTLAAARDDLERRVAERTAELGAANAELSAAKNVADDANRAKTQFLANMSHEIRTPMTAIQGFAELLVDADISEHDRRAYAHTIRRNSEHLQRLLGEVLDLSRIEAGRMELTPQQVALVPLLLDVMQTMHARAAVKELPMRLRYETDVPETIFVDALRLRQVLLNLVGNAVKFTERGHVEVAIALEEGGIAPQLRISVRDTGIGISPVHMPHLFQPFSQADASTTRRYGGSGLGLAICRRLVAAMEGELTVQSEPGVGSTFTLLVDPGPLTHVARIRPASAPLALPGAPPMPMPRGPAMEGRVLLVEDGQDNQLLIATYLRHIGVAVTLAADGVAALEAVDAAARDGWQFGLVLMDMQMPRMDGYEAATRLRERGFTTPIIALTAHTMEGDRQKCLRAGCTDYLAKPVTATQLIAVVQQYLAGTSIAI